MAESASNATDLSKVTVGNVSTLLIPAGKYKKSWRAMAPRTADIWINPAGGPAGPDLTGCFLVKAGTVFGSQPDIVENSQINYWCASANLMIPVVVWY